MQPPAFRFCPLICQIGTELQFRPDGQRERFIPASAGNTRLVAGRTMTSAVHPRVRGEHVFRGYVPKGRVGSSPRPRGTPMRRKPAGERGRFIPASAGNTRGQPDRGARSPGSSPRPRGTPLRSASRRSAPRFIPASAGNTSKHCPLFSRRPVHPRVRGEHVLNAHRQLRQSGSSPRPRGTRSFGVDKPRVHRFIPASAGNTRSASATAPQSPVHPRVRGEHFRIGRDTVTGDGSSPRPRGTQATQAAWHDPVRFIPASAGNTNRRTIISSSESVHPRVRGEHLAPACCP